VSEQIFVVESVAYPRLSRDSSRNSRLCFRFSIPRPDIWLKQKALFVNSNVQGLAWSTSVRFTGCERSCTAGAGLPGIPVPIKRYELLERVCKVLTTVPNPNPSLSAICLMESP